MPLGWRQRLVFRLRVRYKVKRSIFTLLIPVLVAFLIFSAAIYTGFTSIPNLSPTSQTASTGNPAVQSRLQQFQKLFGNSSSINGTSPITNVGTNNPHNFDLVLMVGLTIGLSPYSVDAYLSERKRRKSEADFADFLFELSELVRGGIDPIKAVNTLAEGSVGSITKQVRLAAKQMQIGYTFEQAMRNLSTALKSKLIARYVDLVIQASYSGGGVSNLIQRASADMATFIGLEREKRAGLAQYTLVLYVGQVVLIALCAILVVQFLPELAQISTIGANSFTGSLLASADIGTVPLERDLFFLIVVNGLLGGLVIGKISEGKIKHGVKHGLVLVFIAFAAWSFFVVPATSGAGTHYTYSIVSYDKQGVAGLPMRDPIVVGVNNTDGTPAVTALVRFTLSGPPRAGGSILPASASTGSDGEASATIVLGNLTGIYTIGVTVGGNTTAIAVQGIALGGG